MTQENNKNILNKPVGQTTGSNGGASATQMQKQGGNSEDAVKDAGKGLLEQVRNTAGSAYDSAAGTATTKIDEQKTSLSLGLSSVAESVRRIGTGIQEGDAPCDGVAKVTAEYSDTVAKKLDQVEIILGARSKQMYSDAESFGRRNPAILIGGAFVLGMLAVRFLKSSTPNLNGKNVNGFSGAARNNDVNR